MYAVRFLCILVTALSKGDGTGQMIPKDPYIELGSDIKIMFKSEGISHSHGQIYWTLNKKRINEHFYEIINSTFAAVSLRNFTLQRATVQCHSLTGQILDGTYIYTYSKPSNISCITYITKKKFTCTWEHNSSTDVNYKVYMSCLGNLESESCSTVTRSCTFNRSLCDNYNITVSATGKGWDASSSYVMDPWHTIKLEPPENVKAKTTEFSNRLTVEWDRPENKSLELDSFNCQVKYAQHVDDTVMNPHIPIGSLTTKEVKPCTNHSVSVRCALDKAPWSEWSREATVLSRLNVSAVGFNLWRTIGAPDVSGARRVLVMWEGISPSCKVIDGYRLEVFAGDSPEPIIRLNTTEDELSVTLGEEAHRVTLAGFHGNTIYPGESTYIPATGNGLLLAVRGVRAEPRDGDLLVSWTPPGRSVSGYMVDWTTQGAPQAWRLSRDTNISLTGLQPFKRYNVTVTPLFHDQTGPAYSVQECSQEEAPGNVVLQVDPQDTSARLSWTVLPQRECSGTVVLYTVFYQASNDGPQLNVTVNGDKREVHLERLQPDTQYSVYVRARGVAGATDSTVVHFPTNRYDATFIRLLGSGVAFGIVFFLVAGLCCVIQWRRFREKVVPDPGLSSLAMWSTESCQQKRIFLTPLLVAPGDPAKRDRIYICDVETAPNATGSPPSSGGEEDRRADDLEPTTGEGTKDEGTEDEMTEDETTEDEATEDETSLGCGGRQPVGVRLPPDPPPAPARLPEPDPPVLRPRPGGSYRNQGPEERTAARGRREAPDSGEDSRPLLEGRQRGKAGPLTAYVTVNMLEPGRWRRREEECEQLVTLRNLCE